MSTPLIFLSGLLCDQSIWRAQSDYFSEHYAVSVFSFANINSIDHMAQQVIQHLNTPSIIIGHSMGARVALEVIRQAPELVCKIALLDFGIHPVKEFEAEKRYALTQAAKDQGMEYLIDAWLKPMIHEPNIENAAIFEPMKTMVLQQNASSFALQVDALLNRPEAEAIFKSIQVPLYLGVGREDRWSTLQQHVQMCQLNPAAQLHIYEQCGHMSPVEAENQVNQSLKRWLEASE